MENEIKDNEYIRTDTGKIDKVINANYYMPQYIECEKDLIFKNNIVKHSPNITGVLEKGDLIYTDYGWVWYDYKEVDTIVVYNGKAYIKVDEREINKI